MYFTKRWDLLNIYLANWFSFKFFFVNFTFGHKGRSDGGIWDMYTPNQSK